MTSYMITGNGGNGDDDEAEVVESIVSGKLDRLPPAVPRSVCVFLSSTFSGQSRVRFPAAAALSSNNLG